MIGARLGKWIIERQLGHGGMGEVYLAKSDPEQGRAEDRAAIKILSGALARQPVFQARFQREIEVLRKLDHPNIVRYYEDGTYEGMPYFVMEYVDGRDFGDLVLAGRLDWWDVLDMGIQVCAALKHAHDRGVIHRDLKPSNLLRKSNGHVKLTDFGVAHVFTETDTHLTATGAVVGTVEYISPEQASGKPATKRSDLYSLGVVLYTLLVGKPPFMGTTPAELLHKHRFGQFERPRRLVPELPHDVDEIVCQLLEKDPDKRPTDAGTLSRRLDSIARKLERKAGLTDPSVSEGTTLAGTQAGAAAESDTDESGEQAGIGPATLMSRLMRQELERQNRGGPLNQFFNRPWVLIPLFLVTVGLIAYAFWPQSAESMYQRVAKLMASNDTDDWQQASDLMDKMDEKFPEHRHQTELREFRRRIREQDDMVKAERLADKQVPVGEAQWFYLQGLRLHQEGKTDEARRVWQKMTEAFADVPEAYPWVRLARRELREPSARAVSGEHRFDGVERALKQARELRDAGNLERARGIWQSLEELYRDDPSAMGIMEEVRRDREK